MAHHHKSIIGPLILITVGILLLLNNLHVLPWTIWADLIQFWPVLLILSGIQILLGHSSVSHIIMFLLTAFILFFIVGWLIRPYNQSFNRWWGTTMPYHMMDYPSPRYY